MLRDNSYALAILHSGGLTHKDLTKIFTDSTFDPREVLEKYQTGNGIPTPWITDERRQSIHEKLQKVDQAKIIQTIQEKNIEIITQESPAYPERLRAIKSAPYLLYIRGDLHEERLMLAIVGSRRSTSYGKKILDTLIPDLIHTGAGIVSGGAYGIDAISHEITLAHDGYTISVFGCGIDISYPLQNINLFAAILAK
jgi:DNA processing protein